MKRLVPPALLSAVLIAAPAAALPGGFIVFFEPGSSRIDASDAAILDNFIASAAYFPEGTIIHLEGNADRVGTEQANRRLSCARARAVEQYLVAHGIHPGRTMLYGRGESSPLLETADEVAEANNRNVRISDRAGRVAARRDRAGGNLVVLPDPDEC
jgi:outer membrane protein OmpA-like peptidoglycan-associated protein